MRKNNTRKAIKAVSKKAQKNPNATITTTAVVGGFAIFGMVETGLIIKNKAKAKIEEIKAKKENKKNEDNTNNNEDNNTTEPTEDKKEDNKDEQDNKDEKDNNNEKNEG